MLFNSFEFIFAFLPIVLALYFVAGSFGAQAATGFLSLASLAFYAYWKLEFLPILCVSIVLNYGAGVLIQRYAGLMVGRLVLIVGISADIGALAFYKYADFLITSANKFGTSLPLLDIVLPIGISFFTFTQVAFLIDTWRGTVKEHSFINYVLFVSYFPHLIAGPMLHHSQVMPQFSKESTCRPDPQAIAVGIFMFIIGFAKKVLIADSFAPYATGVFDHVSPTEQPGLAVAWVGALAYTFQIYFDFSGYTDMALGLSKMFGINLPINFNSPYKAASIIDFWRRWHITLSQFLRDYLYIPLGGNRSGQGRWLLNLLITMLLGGLWHGANWTFVFWGGLHGLYLVVNHLWRAWRGDRLASRQSRVASTAISWLGTFLAVVVAWVFFRAIDISHAVIMLRGMMGLNGVRPDASMMHLGGVSIGSGSSFVSLTLLALALIALPNSQTITSLFERLLSHRDESVLILNRKVSSATLSCGLLASAFICGAIFLTSIAMLGRKAEFLYFQF
jgi:D-alanyl-lipoteichoic acid acyltransferase DltB (MBOAT superfamily)